MSLVNQLIAAIFAVLIGLVSGTLYIMSDSSRSVLENQLESHAQDSATHLGLYLAPYMADNDSATIETAVNAIFDSGFYQKITVTNGEQEVLFEKTTPPQVAVQVPLWFQGLIKITPPSMHRTITYQWRQVGSIHVQSRAGYAYEKLWQGAQDSLILFISLSIICLLAISSLVRYLLRPLHQVEEQAIALSEKRYIEQEKLPGTRELKRVVQAMNRMVRQVKKIFEEQSRNIEELRRNAYQDNLTGLANQRSLESQLAERLDYRQDFGRATLLDIQLLNLQQINQQIGTDKTNHLIKGLASQLETLARRFNQSILGRMGGTEFVVLIDSCDQTVIERVLAEFNNELSLQYQQLSENNNSEPLVAIGSSEYSEGKNSSQLLSEARIARDQAIEQAQLWYQFSPEESQGTSEKSSHWKEYVASAINQRKLFLQAQNVLDINQAKPLQAEILARILDKDDQPVPAGEFIHEVKELGLIAEMDRAITELALDIAVHNPTPLTINLSHDAISSDSFISWLEGKLKQISATKVMFEIDETSALNNVERITMFRKRLRELGAGFGIDHFGVHPSGFSYLYAVQPDYIKIDGSLVRNIDENAEDRFFVSSLISVAHSLGISAYAEHVERDSQLSLLNSLEVDGTQGYLHGKPTKLG